MTRPQKGLKYGFSTGTAATAAAAAALHELLVLPCPDPVHVTLPGGRVLSVPLHSHRLGKDFGEATVIKDGGDDPDVTHGAEIGARVRFIAGNAEDGIRFMAGPGVGTFTKPGLPLPPGEPAINPVPRRMITQALVRILKKHAPKGPFRLEVEIFVPRGEELARETLNPRLGILGGISILGTSGIVRPFSHGAWRATIHAALKVARAMGNERIVLVTGTTSDAAARSLFPSLPEEAFIQMGDHVRFSLTWTARLGFSHVTVVAFVGKALKIAQGLGQTHARFGPPDLALLAFWVEELCGRRDLASEVARSATARGAFEILEKETCAGEVLERLGTRLLKAVRSYLGPASGLDAVILHHTGRVLWKGADRSKGS